jgi:hypothetical protein
MCQMLNAEEQPRQKRHKLRDRSIAA